MMGQPAIKADPICHEVLLAPEALCHASERQARLSADAMRLDSTLCMDSACGEQPSKTSRGRRAAIFFRFFWGETHFFFSAFSSPKTSLTAGVTAQTKKDELLKNAFFRPKSGIYAHWRKFSDATRGRAVDARSRQRRLSEHRAAGSERAESID